MSVQLAMLLVTAVLAVVAVAAAVIAMRAVRELRALRPHERPEPDRTPSELAIPPAPTEPVAPTEPAAEVVRIVEGRVIVSPTQAQVVAASMTRPAVRLNIFAAGLVHALRPESRDRISGLMRREYRARRRSRQRAARAAARAQNSPPPAGRGWVGS